MAPDPNNTAPRFGIPPASDKQRELARQLDIPFMEGINRRDMAKLIDAALDQQDQERCRAWAMLHGQRGNTGSELRLDVLEGLDPDLAAQALSRNGRRAVIVTFRPSSKGEVEAELAFDESQMSGEEATETIIRLGIKILQQRYPGRLHLLADIGDAGL